MHLVGNGGQANGDFFVFLCDRKEEPGVGGDRPFGSVPKLFLHLCQVMMCLISHQPMSDEGLSFKWSLGRNPNAVTRPMWDCGR